MIPESISPDDAFIEKPVYSVQVDLPSKLLYRRDRPVPTGGKSNNPSICPGVSYLRTLINKSSSGGVVSSSTITSLCLDPFSFSYPNNESMDHDEILHLIAHCCPNLKHISFDGFYRASIEAVLEVFLRCKKIELINFSYSGYTGSVQVIEELVNCVPDLRGIRMAAGCNGYDAIATHFPWIKLHDEDLLSYQVSFCEECEYDMHVLAECESRYHVCVHLPRHRRRLCYFCWLSQEEEKDKAYLEYLHGEKKVREYSILKEKKKRRRYHHQYVVVLRTRMRKKNKKQEASFILKMKMRKKREHTIIKIFM